MPIMSQEQADALRSRDLISEEQHAAISAQNGNPIGVAAPPPPAAPDPMMSVEPPPDAAPPPAGPPLPEDVPPVALAGGSSQAGSQMSEAPQMMSPEPPPGDVQVGHITQANAPTPPPPPAPTYGASVGRMGATFYDAKTGAPPPEAPAKPVDFRAAAQGKRDEQLDVQSRVARDAGAAKEARAKDQAESLDAFNKEQAAIEAKNAADRQKEANDTAAAIADVNQRVDEYATKKIDPDRFWKNASTGTKVQAALAIGLGGFAEGLSNGAVRNSGLAQINRYVDQDIASQEADLATAGKTIEAKRGVLHDMLQMTGNKEAARSAARIAALSNVEMQAKAIAAKYDPQLEKANTQAVLSGLETERANEREKLEGALLAERRAQAAAAAAQAAKREQTVYERGKEADAAARDWAKIGLETKKAQAEIKKAGSETQVAIPGPDGKPIVAEAASADDKKKINDATEVYLNLHGDLKRLRGMREEYGGEILDRSAVAKSQALASRIRTNLKELEKLGALSGSDYSLLDSQVPADPLARMTTDDTVFGALDETTGGLERGYQNALQARLKGGVAPAVSQDARAAAVPTTKAPGAP